MDTHGGNIYENFGIEMDYSVNLSPLGIPEKVKDAILNSIGDFDRYPDIRQNALREKIGDYYGIAQNKIVCGNGAADLIFRIPLLIQSHSCNKVGLIVSPAFSEYEKALMQADFSVEHYYLKAENGYKADDGLLKVIREGKHDIVFISNPGNPTGVLIPREFVRNLAKLCQETGTLLVLDECFLELTRDEEGCSLISDLDAFTNIIILRSFTKTYGMAGLRLGYALCGSPENAEKLLSIGQPWPLSAPAVAAGIVALEVGKSTDYLERTRGIISSEGRKMVEKLRAMGFDVLEPAANYICFSGPLNLDLRLRDKGILIRNCGNYKGMNQGTFRIAIKMPDENDILMEAMGDCI